MRKLFSIVFSAALLLMVSAQIMWAQKAKVYDLGHFKGGTWAGLQSINDFGVAMGWGDVPIEGGTETPDDRHSPLGFQRWPMVSKRCHRRRR